MPNYMLLLHDDQDAPGFKLSPEEMQRAFEKYLIWRSNSFVVGGSRLDEKTGRVMKKKEGRTTVIDGPYSEGKEVLGGYFTIEAASFEEALDLTTDHPHLDFGSIEIREMIPPPQ